MNRPNEDQTQNENSYINVIIDAFGYINNIKVSPPKSAGRKDEVRLSMAIPYGSYDQENKPRKKYYSMVVPTEQARDVLRENYSAIQDSELKITVGFVASDGDALPFVFKEGKRQGEMGVTHFGSLLKIKWLKVGDTLVYSEKINKKESNKTGTFN